ncbi:MAG: 50S ribosomal protein L30 [Sphaerochaetaceae bacterium]|nr:50S ribosomal protein L30 [Sphaerochaetaceae bacterium]
MIRVELIKSLAGCLPVQRKTVKAIGLGKINSFVVVEDNPVNRGMVTVIRHMVKVEEI